MRDGSSEEKTFFERMSEAGQKLPRIDENDASLRDGLDSQRLETVKSPFLERISQLEQRLERVYYPDKEELKGVDFPETTFLERMSEAGQKLPRIDVQDDRLRERLYNQSSEKFKLPDKISGELDLRDLGKDFTIPEKIIGELKLPNLKETRKIVVALDSVGINSYEFLTGSPSIEEVKKGLTAIKNAGIDMDSFYTDYPQFKVKDLDVEQFFKLNNVNLDKLNLPNLTNENFDFPQNMDLSNIEVPQYYVDNVLKNAGINTVYLKFGNPDQEYIMRSAQALKSVGIDPQKYVPGFENEEGTKGKSI